MSDLPKARAVIISCKTIVWEEAKWLKGEPGHCSVSLNEHCWFCSSKYLIIPNKDLKISL